MQNIKKTFVIMSHKLTDEQIADLNSEVILLSDVNPELAQTVKNLNPHTSLTFIMRYALVCIHEAIMNNCTQMVCMGEPCFAMWVNMFASCNQSCYPYFWRLNWDMQGGVMKTREEIEGQIKDHWRTTDHGDDVDDGNSWFTRDKKNYFQFVCLQSTTKRESVDIVQEDGSVKKISVFKHVQWRNLFTLVGEE